MLLLSAQLIETARQRLETKPSISEADLRRATSDLYFALFHCVCEAVVEPVSGESDNPAYLEVYTTLYRLPDHAHVEKRCKEVEQHEFSASIKRFAQQLAAFKNKRTQADYDPISKFKRSTVLNDIEVVDTVVQDFKKSDQVERARFAYFVSIRKQR